jgi:hypothetical protein
MSARRSGLLCLQLKAEAEKKTPDKLKLIPALQC